MAGADPLETGGVQLDAGRLRDLRIFSENELREIGRRATSTIAAQLEAVDQALARQDLAAAGEAAHRARNEALLMGARELAEALGSIEEAVRSERSSQAREAAGQARALWPPTREAIERATQRATG